MQSVGRDSGVQAMHYVRSSHIDTILHTDGDESVRCLPLSLVKSWEQTIEAEREALEQEVFRLEERNAELLLELENVSSQTFQEEELKERTLSIVRSELQKVRSAISKQRKEFNGEKEAWKAERSELLNRMDQLMSNGVIPDLNMVSMENLKPCSGLESTDQVSDGERVSVSYQCQESQCSDLHTDFISLASSVNDVVVRVLPKQATIHCDGIVDDVEMSKNLLRELSKYCLQHRDLNNLARKELTSYRKELMLLKTMWADCAKQLSMQVCDITTAILERNALNKSNCCEKVSVSSQTMHESVHVACGCDLESESMKTLEDQHRAEMVELQLSLEASQRNNRKQTEAFENVLCDRLSEVGALLQQEQERASSAEALLEASRDALIVEVGEKEMLRNQISLMNTEILVMVDAYAELKEELLNQTQSCQPENVSNSAEVAPDLPPKVLEDDPSGVFLSERSICIATQTDKDISSARESGRWQRAAQHSALELVQAKSIHSGMENRLSTLQKELKGVKMAAAGTIQGLQRRNKTLMEDKERLLRRVSELEATKMMFQGQLHDAANALSLFVAAHEEVSRPSTAAIGENVRRARALLEQSQRNLSSARSAQPKHET